MKIIYCLAGTFNSGGMERIVAEKANWLARNGYDIVIVTTEQKGRKDFFPLEKNVTRIDLDILYSETNDFSPLKKIIARSRRIKMHRKRLTELLLKEAADIVISTFGNEIGFLSRIKDGSKKIAEIHFARWFRLQLNRKGIWRLIDKYLTWKDVNIVNTYDRFVCLTQEDKLNWHNVSNLVVIPNFIKSKSVPPAILDFKSMIAVGRLSYQKGYDRLIDAWKIVHDKYPEWKLNIFGNGELECEIADQILKNGLQESIYIFPPTHDIISEYLRNSALVSSSRYEGLPMVFLEAMNCGLPIISFTCQCGPKDIIIDKYNGILVNDSDIRGLADAIMLVISSKHERKVMGQNAYFKAQEYSQEIVMAQWVELFNSIVTLENE